MEYSSAKKTSDKRENAEGSTYSKSIEKKVKPFLKWAGGKGQLLSEIEKYYPFEKGGFRKYAEPFVGGGAVLFDVLSKYDVPMGAYKNPMICDEANLRAVSEKLQKVTVVCGDYRESADFIDENTFVYFDPPYRPITDTASFTAYKGAKAVNGFDI